MKYDIHVIQDLLPLYVDDVLSPETTAIVSEYIQVYPELKEELAILESEKAIKQKEILEYETQTNLYTERIHRWRKSLLLALLGVCVLIGAITFGFTKYYMTNQIEDYEAVDFASYSASKYKLEKLKKEGNISPLIGEGSESILIIFNKNKEASGRFQVSSDERQRIIFKLKPTNVSSIKKLNEPVEGMFNEVKEVLEKAPEGVEYYEDDHFVYAILPDNTIYYFKK